MNQLRDLAFWDERYLQELPVGEFEWLELKDSRFFTLDAAFLDRVSTYLSAYANYDGGYLVIGIENPEVGNPLKIDGGVALKLKNNVAEWLEEKLPNLVEPALERIRAVAIPATDHSSSIKSNHAVIVIHVLPSEQAPHQARDKKYWGRLGNKLHPLGHRAIMDILGRRKHPKIETKFFVGMSLHPDKNQLICRRENVGHIMARYVFTVVECPLKIGGYHVAFEDEELIGDDDETSYWRLKASNHLNRPLFPGSDITSIFNFKVIGGPMRAGASPDSPKIMKTIPMLRFKTFADEMPFQEGKVDLEKIITRTQIY